MDYIKEQHTSVDSALGYWTYGATDPFFDALEHPVTSKEYWINYTKTGLVVVTSASGGMIIGRGSSQIGRKAADEFAEGTGKVVNNFTKDDLIKIASQPHGKRNTQVGRAYQKHANRDGTSFAGYRGGDPTKNTDEGLNHLNRILDNPNSTSSVRNHNAYGEIIEVKLPNGQGARWSSDGSRFIGFIEP